MSFWVGLAIVLLLAAVVFMISAPLRATGSQPKVTSAARAQLLAEREAKYREIRDAEMDYRTGKLSEEDFQAIDAQLRSEAIRILDALGEQEPEESEFSGQEED
jgi:hypothetical protein